MLAPRFAHLLFDLFGTLVDYAPQTSAGRYARTCRLLSDAGVDLSEAQFLRHWERCFAEFDGGAAELEEYSMHALGGYFLRQLFGAEPTSELLDGFVGQYLSEWNTGVDYSHDVGTVLARLVEHFTLVLVTNTHDASSVAEHLRRAGITDYFEHVVTSVEHGRRKPCPSIFARALELSGGRKETSLFIGDSYEADYQGATAAGIRCWLIDPGNRHGLPADERLDHVREVPMRLSELGYRC